MNEIKVEVLNAPVPELFFAYWGYAFLVVEGVPELRDDEKVGTFDNTFFYGSGNSLAGFWLVAVVC